MKEVKLRLNHTYLDQLFEKLINVSIHMLPEEQRFFNIKVSESDYVLIKKEIDAKQANTLQEIPPTEPSIPIYTTHNGIKLMFTIV